ncbi:ATP-binding cassette sub-family C member 9-like isoform X1 [Penaeus japonicus]|uniref:ATP-binding cassette sub-family C member 9-like isoform X1 n=1 Tax=Penaeus japonicus TaxID=27405 RepID=UPI001C711040|nr:ATP-binding cassette sub-family C member 9-like isoform X1 [Penaeus japonicus]
MAGSREVTLTEVTTEVAFNQFLSSVYRGLTQPPPSARDQVNLTGVMARLTARTPAPPPPLLSPDLPDTSDLLGAALGGATLLLLLLVLLFRGCCAKPAAPAPTTPTLLPAHVARTLVVLALVLVQVGACGEAALRHWKSPRPHVLLTPAPVLTLASTLVTAAYYHALETWAAHGYVTVSTGVWAWQSGLGMLRLWQVVVGEVSPWLVYPCLSAAAALLSALLLALDAATLATWIYRRHHCEVLEITPGVGAAGGAGVTYKHPLVSLPARATFVWFLELLRLGWRRPLEFSDLGKLPREEESRVQYERFSRNYNAEQLRCQTKDAKRTPSLWRVFVRTYWRQMAAGGAFKVLGDAVNCVAPLAIALIVTYVTDVQAGTVVRSGAVVGKLYYVGWSEAVHNGWVVAGVALVAALAQSTFSQASTHLVAMEGIHVKAALQAMVYHKSLRLSATAHEEPEARPRHASQDKGQEGSQGARGGVDAGGVINLSSEDADNIMTFFMHCHYIWAIPLKIGVILALLWRQLGVSAVVAAVTGILFLTPLQFVLCKNIAAVNKNFLDVSDDRLRQTHELVTGIKLVKLHAWEDVFIRRVTSIRERELHLLYKDSIYRALMTFLTQGSGVLVSLVTFGLYSILEDVALEPARVFSGLALFNQLTVPLFILPIIVSHTIRAKNSTRRLQEFLSLQEVEGPRTPKTPITLRPLGVLRGGGGGGKGRAGGRGKVCRTPRNSKGEGLLDDLRQNRLGRVVEESRPTSTCSEVSNASSVSKKSSKENGSSPFSVDLNSDSEEELEFEGWKKRRSAGGNGDRGSDGRKVAVRIQSGSFAWDSSCRHSVLENITTDVPAGGLTVVVGGVGAGKTSLLLAMLGEMHTLRGELHWNGEMSVAYVSQHPWLTHATLRDNVVFGKQLLAKRYNRVIQACALAPDIEILPGGDQTEIGERGINLSGGQRQRVAIARALYSDARTVIMDAPFSALDAGVSAKVWEEGVLKLLLQRRRTVILATHLTHLTRHATKIIYLEGGSIKHQGTPSEVARAAPELWREWGAKEGAPVGGYDQEGRLDGRTARERWSLLRLVTRISIQRGSASPHHTRRGGREESKEVEYCPRPVRKYSINRHVSHSALLPGDECEYLPALTPPLPRHAFAHTPSKLPLFRIKSSAPAFGRKSSRAARGGLPRHAKSLPPQPRPLPRMRSSPAFAPQGNMLHRLFSSASTKSTKRPSTSPSDKWHLGRVISSANNLGDNLDEDLELEEEVPLEDDVEDGRLVAEEERERGRISKWNYVVYLRACGLTFGLGYLFCALLGQGVSVMLDFWLGEWSGKANVWNMTMKSQWEAYETHLRQKTLPGERAKPVDPQVLNVADNYTAYVEETMVFYYKVYVILSVVSVLLSLSTNILGQVAAARGRQRLHQDMLQNLAKCAVRFFDTTPAGRIMNRFTTDTAMIDKELARSVTHLLFFVLLVTSAVAVNAVVTPAFLVVAAPICGLYYAVQKFFRCSSRELKRLESLSRSPLYSHISESVAGAVVVRAYGHQRRFTDVLLHRLDTHVTAFTLLHAGNRWLGICLDYIGGVIVFCATVTTLLWSTVFQDLSPAKVGLAINYTLLVPVYLNWVVRFLADTEMCLNAVERVQQYATLPAEDARRATPARDSSSARHRRSSSRTSDRSRSSSGSGSTSRSSGLPPGWPLEGRVEFQSVTLTYDPVLPPVLSGLTFTINPGEKVGLCGRTGSGKSSLILSLYRIVEASRGRILLDGTNILGVPLQVLRASISVIPQDTHLFHGSVRFNLDPLGQHPDERLWLALEIAQLKPLIASMPAALESEVGEGGSSFSAGQRQLFCVARAVLRRSSLLVMDEATSALDAATERALHLALKTAFSHATVITIAHGVSSLLEYPRVLVLENGHLVEDGDPKELARKENGAFAKLLTATSETPKS